MKPLACVLRLNCISLHSPFLHSAESLFKMHDNEKLHFCNYRCKILYDSICKQGEFISLYSCMWNPAVQFVCAACSIKHLSFQALICPTDCHLSLIEEQMIQNLLLFLWGGGWRGLMFDGDKFIILLCCNINNYIDDTLSNNSCAICRRWRTNHRSNEWRGQWSEWQS